MMTVITQRPSTVTGQAMSLCNLFAFCPYLEANP